jgi:hypothetical protein
MHRAKSMALRMLDVPKAYLDLFNADFFLPAECLRSAQCAPAKHHYDECAERVTKQQEETGKAEEDCVEECEYHRLARDAHKFRTDIPICPSLPHDALRHSMRRSQALQGPAVNGEHEQQASAPCSTPAKRGKECVANESAETGQGISHHGLALLRQYDKKKDKT